MDLPPGVLSQQGSAGINKQENTVNAATAANIQHYSATVEDDSEYSSSLQWFLSLLLYGIPIINIIYVAVVAIKSDDDKKNWAKAAVFMLIVTYIIDIAVLIFLKNTTMSEIFDMLGQSLLQ